MEAGQNISTKEIYFKPYAYFLERYGVSYEVKGAWLVHGKPNHDNQWIVCLSISVKNTEAILDRVIKYLERYGYAFVLIKDQLQHNRINNNAFPLAFFGKALIIFSPDITYCDMLAKDLAKMTKTFEGPHIPNCIRLGSIVYVAFSKLNPDYKGEKHQIPFCLEKVNNADELFPEHTKWKQREISRFIKKRYLPILLIKSSYKGNILKGLDLYKMRWVFIKQARPWATEDIYGRQMRDRLLWQMKVSKDLTAKVNLPKVLDYVEQEGYCYLITEYIQGILLDVLPKEESNSPEIILSVYLQTVKEVQKMHAAGYVHRDITSKNIFIREKDHKVYLADFELSYPLVSTGMVPYDSGTVGYMSPQQSGSQTPTKSDDVFSLGALLYYLVGNEYPDKLASLSEKERTENIEELKVPDEIKSFIRGCTLVDSQIRWDMDKLSSAVSNVMKSNVVRSNQKRKAIKFRNIKKKLAISGIMILLAFFTVFSLWKLSDEPNSRNNGFDRLYIQGDLKPMYRLNIPKDIRFIVGVIGDSLFLSTSVRGQFALLDLPKREIERKMFTQESNIIAKLSKSPFLQIDSLGYTLFDGISKMILIKSRENGPLISHTVAEPFTRAVRFSKQSVTMRKFKNRMPEQYFYRYDLIKDTALNENQVTELKNDVGLVTGGFLDYEKNHSFYVTRYANRIYQLDTNMNIIREGHTIDTFSNYTLKSSVVENNQGGVITNDGPPRYVNKAMAVENGRLYIYSYVKADNESTYEFINSNVIDVYDANTLKYIGSQRLQTDNKSRIRNFKISNGKLYAVCADAIRIYDLSLNKKENLKIAGL